MTHDEMIEAGGMAIFEVSPDRKAGTWLEAHFQTRAKYREHARAAIRVIAPAVLDEAAKVAPAKIRAEGCETVGQWERRALREAIRALKTRYE